jgi:hypothetical protein
MNEKDKKVIKALVNMPLDSKYTTEKIDQDPVDELEKYQIKLKPEAFLNPIIPPRYNENLTQVNNSSVQLKKYIRRLSNWIVDFHWIFTLKFLVETLPTNKLYQFIKTYPILDNFILQWMWWSYMLNKDLEILTKDQFSGCGSMPWLCTDVEKDAASSTNSSENFFNQSRRSSAANRLPKSKAFSNQKTNSSKKNRNSSQASHENDSNGKENRLSSIKCEMKNTFSKLKIKSKEDDLIHERKIEKKLKRSNSFITHRYDSFANMQDMLKYLKDQSNELENKMSVFTQKLKAKEAKSEIQIRDLRLLGMKSTESCSEAEDLNDLSCISKDDLENTVVYLQNNDFSNKQSSANTLIMEKEAEDKDNLLETEIKYSYF